MISKVLQFFMKQIYVTRFSCVTANICFLNFQNTDDKLLSHFSDTMTTLVKNRILKAWGDENIRNKNVGKHKINHTCGRPTNSFLTSLVLGDAYNIYFSLTGLRNKLGILSKRDKRKNLLKIAVNVEDILFFNKLICKI